MTCFSLGVNGKNQAKKKEKPQVCRIEEAFVTVKAIAFRDEEVRHGEGCYSLRRRGSWMKTQSQVHRNEEALRRNEGKCLKYQSQVHRSKEALLCDEVVCHGEDTVHRGEDKIYVYILVLNQT